MDAREAARLEHERRRWLRPDWERHLRPDWERYVQPAHREAMRQEFAERKAAFEKPRERAARLREEQAALERKQASEAEAAEGRLKSDLAWQRFEAVMAWLQQKANFNRNQPRTPKGNGIESGRWAAGPGIGHNSDK